MALPLNWGILVAFTASIPMISAPLILFYLGLVFWTIGYDTIYACQDVEDDAMIGVKIYGTVVWEAHKIRRWYLLYSSNHVYRICTIYYVAPYISS